MIILEKKECGNVPFKWIDLDDLRESNGYRLEGYLNSNYTIEHLILMFYDLFGACKNDLVIYESGWGDFCLDTWNVHNDTYDYSLENKTAESKEYILMLQESNIAPNYVGCCSCNNWDKYLYTTLNCILNHVAPYGQKIFHLNAEFFFYFHHSYSMGFYFKEKNAIIDNILKKLNNSDEYDVEY